MTHRIHLRTHFIGCCTILVLIASGSIAGDIEVIFSEAPGHPTAQVPGAKDLAGNPATTEFKALETLSVSPDGSYWIVKGRNWLGSDLETMLLLGSGATGDMLGQEGQPIPDGAAGELYDFFGSSPAWFNDLNQFCFTARARGGDPDTKQKGLFFDGTNFTIVRMESDPALGLIDLPPNPSGDELFGNSFGSMHVLNDGTFGYHDATIKNIHTSRRPAVFYNDTAFQQCGLPPTLGGGSWEGMDANTFWTTPDGGTWTLQGDDTMDDEHDDILVVNDAVVLREGNPIPGTSIQVAAVFHTKLLTNGYWYSRGDDPADNDWAVINGALVAATGDPIIAGSTEHWAAVFQAFAGNTAGDWVLAGRTDNPDTAADEVLVLNGTTIIAREGDPIDLDGNGQFDDDAFIGRGVNTNSAFHPDDLWLTADMWIYFFVSLRNAAGEDLGSFGTGGDAFLRVQAGGPGCPNPGASGYYCTADLDANCEINISDLAALLSTYGMCPGDPGYIAAADLTDDGNPCIAIADLATLLGQYNDVCH